jgi:hypothetical protein
MYSAQAGLSANLVTEPDCIPFPHYPISRGYTPRYWTGRIFQQFERGTGRFALVWYEFVEGITLSGCVIGSTTKCTMGCPA